MNAAGEPKAKEAGSTRLTEGAHKDNNDRFKTVDNWNNKQSARMDLGRHWTWANTFKGYTNTTRGNDNHNHTLTDVASPTAMDTSNSGHDGHNNAPKRDCMPDNVTYEPDKLGLLQLAMNPMQLNYRPARSRGKGQFEVGPTDESISQVESRLLTATCDRTGTVKLMERVDYALELDKPRWWRQRPST